MYTFTVQLVIFLLLFIGKKWIEARRGPIPERKNSLSVSSIAGILVAVILVIISITIATYFYIKHR